MHGPIAPAATKTKSNFGPSAGPGRASVKLGSRPLRSPAGQNVRWQCTEPRVDPPARSDGRTSGFDCTSRTDLASARLYIQPQNIGSPWFGTARPRQPGNRECQAYDKPTAHR